MAAVWDHQTLLTAGFTQVRADLDWYDGPRTGLVNIDGSPHYYENDDYQQDLRDRDEYFVWPIGDDVAALEVEQWRIFVSWNQRHESGNAALDSHPGHGGIDSRYDELAALLAPHRAQPPDARRLRAEWRFDHGDRYRLDGTDSWVRWSPAPTSTSADSSQVDTGL